MRLIAFLSMAMVGVVSSAMAATKHSSIVYNDWTVHAKKKNGQLYCFMVSTPKKISAKEINRNTPYVMVTHVNRFTDEVSVTPGYKIDSDKPVSLTVDSRVYQADLVENNTAWLKDKNKDKQVIGAMKKGKELYVKTKAEEQANSSIDMYSLQGFSKAFRRMKFLCKHVAIRP